MSYPVCFRVERVAFMRLNEFPTANGFRLEKAVRVFLYFLSLPAQPLETLLNTKGNWAETSFSMQRNGNEKNLHANLFLASQFTRF